MGWEELMRWVERAGAARNNGIDLGKWFKMEEEQTNPNQPKKVKVTLPTREMVIEGDTNGYLVLIAQDKESIIMPKYGKFLNDKLPEVTGTG